MSDTSLFDTPLKDYQIVEMVNFRPEKSLIIQRAKGKVRPEKSVILKTMLDYSALTFSILENEYEMVSLIRSFHQSPVLTVSNQPEKESLGKSSWRGPANMKSIPNCIPCIVEFRKSDDCCSLIFDDFGGEALLKLINKENGAVFLIEEIIEISVQLSRALEIVHRAKVIHQDVNPGNIQIWRDKKGKISAQLMEFGMSTSYDASFNVNNEARETIAYMSPEQTGRLDRIADFRTDFYSLGITMWEMLLGRTPFEYLDATQMIYSHLARKAKEPHLINPDIPVTLSKIVMKLMMKDPNDRYQNASALTFDLCQCLDAIQSYKSSNHILGIIDNSLLPKVFERANIVVGKEDISTTLIFPKGMIGRDKQLGLLNNLYKTISQGKSPEQGNIVLLEGSIGIGRQMLLQTAAKNALLFDMVTIFAEVTSETRCIPFISMRSIMEQLLESLLTKPSQEILHWEKQLVNVLEKRGIQILLRMIPKLHSVLEEVPEISSDMKFTNEDIFCAIGIFLRSFATSSYPFAIILRNIPLNEERIELLQYLRAQNIPYLLIIVQFESTIPDSHVLAKYQRLAQDCIKIEVASFTKSEVKQFFETCMKPPPTDCTDLVEAMLQKNNGNPHALIETTRLCEEKGYIRFDLNINQWTWDIRKIINSIELSQDIVDILKSKLHNLPPESITVLEHASCIGLKFNMNILSTVMEMSYTSLYPILSQLSNVGIIVFIGNYNAKIRVSAVCNSNTSLNNSDPAIGLTSQKIAYYRFSHSKILQEVVGKMDELEKARIHLKIARTMKADHASTDEYMEILTHYNQALKMLVEEDEIVEVAIMNYEAAKQTIMGSPAEDTIQFTSKCLELLSSVQKNQVRNYGSLIFEIYTIHCKAMTSLGKSDESISQYLKLESEIIPSHKGAWLRNLISFMASKEPYQGYKLSLKTLLEYGVDIPDSVEKCESKSNDLLKVFVNELKTRESHGSFFARTCSLTDNEKTILSIIDELQAISRLLPNTQAVRKYITALAANYSIKSVKSPINLMAIVPVLRYIRGSESNWAELELADSVAGEILSFDLSDASKASVMWNLGVEQALSWSLKEAGEKWLKALDSCIKSKQFHLIFIFFAFHVLNGAVSSGKSLDEVGRISEIYNKPIEQVKIEWSKNLMTACNSAIRSLVIGKLEENKIPVPSVAGYISYTNAINAMIHFLPNRSVIVEEALALNSRKCWMLIDLTLFSIICESEEQISCPVPDKDYDIEQREKLSMMKRYIGHQKEGEHKCKLYFALAEMSIKDNDILNITKNYELAAESAAKFGNLLFHGMILERHALFWKARGIQCFYKNLIVQSFKFWKLWGCRAKLDLMLKCYDEDCSVKDEKLHIEVETEKVRKSPTGNEQNNKLSAKPNQQKKNSLIDIDVDTVLKVSKAIANETDLSKLIKTILDNVLKNTGATKALFYLNEDEKLELYSYIDVGQNTQLSPQRELQSPWTILNYVKATKEPQLFDDTPTSGAFSKDMYLKKFAPRSILCCPIIFQNNLSGIVYLENELQPKSFSLSQQALVVAIMSSASLSIENAKLSRKNTELSIALEAGRGLDTLTTPRYQISAPSQRAVDAIKDLQKMFQDNETIMKTFEFVLKTLASDSLFDTTVDDINDEQGHAIDDDTKEWIKTSLLQKSSIYQEQRTPNGALRDIISSPNRLMEFDSAKSWNLQIVDYLKLCTSSEFDIFKFNELTQGQCLYYLSMYLMKKHELLEEFDIEVRTLHHFLKAVEGSYHMNPYHNNIHAADVLQTVGLLILDSNELTKHFSKLELFALCLAAIIHDMDHPGVGNAFLVASSHPMATLYNDISVLESHHVSSAFEILKSPEAAIFKGASVEQFKMLRELIINIVLATDMAQHFAFISKFKGKLSTSSLSLQDQGDRQLVLKFAVKCSDVGNPGRKFELAKRWTSLIMEEFFRQGEMEAKLGLPISKFMDRNDTNVCKCQIGFIDFLVKPLFECWDIFHPTEVSKEFMLNINQNRETWAYMQDKPFTLDPIPSEYCENANILETNITTISFGKSGKREHRKSTHNPKSRSEIPSPVSANSDGKFQI